MEKFEFDEERTVQAMAHASTVDLFAGQVTLYAVVCIGSGRPGAKHFSHGGQLCLDAATALELARTENENMAQWAADEDDLAPECRYLPLALGIDPESLLHLAHLVEEAG